MVRLLRTPPTLDTSPFNLRGYLWICNHWLPSGFLTTGGTGSGSRSWADEAMSVGTGSTGNSTSWVRKRVRMQADPNTSSIPQVSWSNPLRFFVMFDTSVNSLNISHCVAGGVTDLLSGDNIYPHVGVKTVNADVLATVADGYAESALLLETRTAVGFTLKVVAVYEPGKRVRYWYQDAYVGEIKTNLPFGSISYGQLFYAGISNREAASKTLALYEARVFTGKRQQRTIYS